MTSGSITLDAGTVILVVLAGFAAGWVDAVVGGGGLVQLPALLLIPGITPLQALATNKLAGIMGTTVSAMTFYRRLHPDLRTALPGAAGALVGAFGGAVLAAQIPAAAFTPIILAVLIGVLLFTLLKPTLGAHTDMRWSDHRHVIGAVLIGLGIGAYDGLLGPGTGTFLVIACVSVLGYAFLPASAIAKIINVATNLGALVFFVPHGAVLWVIGLCVGAANLAGGYLGARMAIAKGSGFVRVVFVVIVSLLIVKLGWNVIADW